MDVSILIASAVTFFFGALLTVSGVGAAFIIIPVLVALGVGVHQAMATALLLNAIAMALASERFIRKKLVVFSLAVPIAIFGSISAPVCAYLSTLFSRGMLLWVFAGFCIFAGSIMFKKKPFQFEIPEKWARYVWPAIGLNSGVGGGFLGVGGGNLIVAIMIILGYDAKKASATTAFSVIFICLAALLGHFETGFAPTELVVSQGIAAAAGALVGAWLLTEKLSSVAVKRIVGVVLWLIAIRVIVFDIFLKAG